MAKTSKLVESPTRFAETRLPGWQEALDKYLREIDACQTEAARSHRFAMLMQEFTGLQPDFIDGYATGIEKYVRARHTDRILRGDVDNLFGNVVIEFETAIPKKQPGAEDQLRRYVAILWSNEEPGHRTPYVALATDGVRFVTYTPVLADGAAQDVTPEQVELVTVEWRDWSQCDAAAVFYWLDRYFCRREPLPPTSEAIVADFGSLSHAFQVVTHALLALWQERRSESSFKILYENWEKYLRIVYGSDVADDELFIRHTYLATLAKLMSWLRITESTDSPDDSQIASILEGRFFREQGIENYIDEDLFSWLMREPARRQGVAAVRWLFSLLRNYRLRELSEDILKSLYQDLVDPKTRHDLGEYYTPDWLAHRIVNHVLDINQRGKILDPSCGSGTFIYLAIREIRKRLGDSASTLAHLQEAIVGMDVHPLAVTIARTNYILALGDLLTRRQTAIRIPVYLANAVQLPERINPKRSTLKVAEYYEREVYEVRVEGSAVYFSDAILRNSATYDRAVECIVMLATEYQGREISQSQFQSFLEVNYPGLPRDPDTMKSLYRDTRTLKALVEKGRDSIWAFILKNIYKPWFLIHQFDFVVGNPPWLAYRYADPDYQGFLKEQITKKYDLLSPKSGNLMTHMELGALFLLRAADLYLRTGGLIAFVLPRSVFSADQHDRLRRRQFKLSTTAVDNLTWEELWDCDQVAPLFKVPACVVFGRREQTKKVTWPVRGQRLSGKLTKRNASLDDAEGALTVEEVEFSLQTRGKRSYWAVGPAVATAAESCYKRQFSQGATIVPRSFWFVKIKESSLGFNPDLPPIETDPRAIEESKPPYRDVVLHGNIEPRFLFSTLLSADLLPFAHLSPRLVVLPLATGEGASRILEQVEAREQGFLKLADWLRSVEAEWVKHRTAKAAKMTSLDWLDYRKKLTSQDPRTGYKVIYNTSGTIPTATVIEPETIHVAGVRTNGFIVDHVTYSAGCEDVREASYLCAILNSPRVNELIKPMQARGLWGPRHIHKKVLELPIPKYDACNAVHSELAELGEACRRRVLQYLQDGTPDIRKSIGRLRSDVRQKLAPQLAAIDELVRGIVS